MNCDSSYDVIEGIPVLLKKITEETKLSVGDYYKEEAKSYNITHGSDLYGTEYNISKHYLPIFQKYLAEGDNVVLEIGAGTGRFTKVFAGFTDKLLTSDISLPMFLQGQKIGVQADRICCDTEHLPFQDHSFDICVGVNTFSYLPDKQRALSEIRRILKPGGRLLLIDMNRNSFIYRVGNLKYGTHRVRNNPPCVNESNINKLKSLFHESGFLVDDSGVMSWVPHALPRWMVFPMRLVDLVTPMVPFLNRHTMRLFITGRRD